MIGLLDEVFQYLVLELSHERLINLEIDEAMTEVSLKTECHLNEILSFCQLLLLNLEYFLQEFIACLILLSL